MKINVLNVGTFQEMLPMLLKRKDVLLISIRNVSDHRLVDDTPSMKTFWFEDTNDENDPGALKDSQANKIVRHIQANLDKVEAFIHCSAGVCRSGAVGEVLFDYTKFMELTTESYQDFKKRNFKIVPNQYVKKKIEKNLNYF